MTRTAVPKAQVARERARGRKIKGKFLFEGEPSSMADFFADNADMPISAADARAIKALKPGQKLLLGGGAAATMEMERLGSLPGGDFRAKNGRIYRLAGPNDREDTAQIQVRTRQGVFVPVCGAYMVHGAVTFACDRAILPDDVRNRIRAAFRAAKPRASGSVAGLNGFGWSR